MSFTIEFNDKFTTKSPDPSILTAPTAEVKYSFDADVELKTDEGKQLQGIIAVEFQKKMKNWKTEQERKFDEAIKWTVENYKKKKEAAIKAQETKKFGEEMEKFAETANQLLKQGIQTMLDQVEVVAKDMFKKAIETIAKKMKRAINLKKLIAVGKIIAFTGLIIVAAALAIAVTVLSHGAAAPLILGAIVTGVGAAKKIYDTANKAWPTRAKAANALANALDEYVKAVAYELKKQVDEQTRSLGPKERIKRAMNSVSGKRKDVISAIKDLETWGNAIKSSIEKMAQQSTGMSDDVMKLGKSGFPPDSKEFKAMTLAEKKLTVALNRQMTENKGLDELIDEAKVEIAKEVPEQGKITGLIGRLKSIANSPIVSDIVDAISIIGGMASSGDKILKAA
jgi:phosphate uptake regulator